MKKATRMLSSLTAATLLFSSVAAAAADITLKLAHVYPANHYHWTQGLQPFTQRVIERTAGAVDFQVYPAGQLGKDQISLLQYGIADIGLLVPSLQTDKLPLLSVAELPGMYSTSCEATAKLNSIINEGDLLYEEEIAKLKVRPLVPIVLRPYAVVTRSRVVNSVGDFSGLKLRANGAAIGETFRELNSVPVQVGATDLYNAATRGTVDGAYFPYSAIPSYSLENVFKHGLDGLQLGAGAAMLVISERAWDRLTPETQEIMMEESDKAWKEYCAWIDNDHIQLRERLIRDHGMDIVVASEDLVDQINGKINLVNDQWVKRMQSIGKPGKEVLEDFINAASAR